MKKSLLFLTASVLLLCGCGKYEAKMPTGVEEAEIFVEPVEGISDDFFRGVDLSTIIVEEESGAKYFNKEGKEEDVFKILADSGVNSIRVRVWNDPYDANGNPYGGGNCDAENAVKIAKRAAKYGMTTLVDFHYSDFWADPSKQMVPKAWEGMRAEEKGEAAYEFTYDTLEKIINEGGIISGIQVGNETNPGMSGESIWSSVTKIMAGGSRAAREISEKYKQDIKVCVHFTNPEDRARIASLAEKLKTYDLDYDVFAFSYYPYWHGTLDNLEKIMSNIKNNYGKDVMVVENSYMYTLEDGDGTSNSVNKKELCDGYGATVQSQANEVRDVCNVVAKVGGLGFYYWEPAWIPVDSSTWEKGSGWATSFAGEYDPDDAGVYYGGCAWDNQAMFDFEGHVLPSLSVFKYLKYGATSETKVDFVNDVSIELIMGEELSLPEKVEAHFNDRSQNGPANVTWNNEEKDAVNTNEPGEYTVSGTFDDGSAVHAFIKIQGTNILRNAGFEESDRSMWTITEKNSQTVDYQQKEGDAHSGEWAMHYWSSGDVEFTAEQTLTGLENGKYTIACFAQGGDNGNSPSMSLYAKAGGKDYSESFLTDGWINWKNPVLSGVEVTDQTLTFGVNVSAAAGAWGTFDDFIVYRQ